MEVKICQQTKEFENSGLQTSIFEAESINYEFIRYENLPQFNALVRSRTGDTTLHYYGIPTWMREEKLQKNECESGNFLLLSFLDNTEKDYSYLVCKDCVIYITNKGQTIDKIIAQ